LTSGNLRIINRVSLFFQLADKIVRGQLLSVQPEELTDIKAIVRKATLFYAVFLAVRSIADFTVTGTRIDNMAEKRHEKRNESGKMPPLTSQFPPTWVGPVSASQSGEDTKETQRVASISDPSKSSAGSKFFYACQEDETRSLGNLFCEVVLTAVFQENTRLDWVPSRPQPPVLEWRSRYLSSFHL
jgi:hypothetical protein